MFEYKLIRSDRKTLSLEVTREAEIIIRAPRKLCQKEIDTFLEKHTPWLEKTLIRQKNKRDKYALLNEEDISLLKEKAQKIIPEKVEFFSEIIGVHPNGVKITSAKKRFGSCSSKGTLCFSFYLMLYPDEAIDYVVIHELCHIIEPNHKRAFYALVEKYMPEYKRAEKLLK